MDMFEVITRALAAYERTGDLHADNVLPMLLDIYTAHGEEAAYKWAAYCVGPKASQTMRAAMTPVFLMLPAVATADEKKEA